MKFFITAKVEAIVEVVIEAKDDDEALDAFLLGGGDMSLKEIEYKQILSVESELDSKRYTGTVDDTSILNFSLGK